MNEQPTALRLADWLDGSSNGPLDARHKAAAELRRLHELAESEGRWASDYLKRAVTAEERITTLETALRQAAEPVAVLHRNTRFGILRVEYTDEVTELDDGVFNLYAEPQEKKE